MLRSWGKWMAKARGMAAEFRGHVDEMVRQSELDDVKKQLVDLQSLDPTKEIKSIVQEGVAEGEKALADAKSTFDNPLAEPESAPQIAVEAAPETAPAEAAPATEPAPTPVVAEAAPETDGATPPPAEVPAVEEKPAKAVAAG